jgi:hypothetical protein
MNTTHDNSRDDARLYVPRPEGWQAHVKSDSQKEYCHLKNSGEEHFHLLTTGEVYLENNEEKFCLNCALSHGFATRNRLHWQRSSE